MGFQRPEEASFAVMDPDVAGAVARCDMRAVWGDPYASVESVNFVYVYKVLYNSTKMTTIINDDHDNQRWLR